MDGQSVKTTELGGLSPLFPRIQTVIADAGHESRKLARELWREKRGHRASKITGLTWIVERTFAWLGRNRRFSKDTSKVSRMLRRWAAEAGQFGYGSIQPLAEEAAGLLEGLYWEPAYLKESLSRLAMAKCWSIRSKLQQDKHAAGNLHPVMA